MNAWDDPDFIRDEREANPPEEPVETDIQRMLRLVAATDARLTRELAERGYNYIPDHDPDATVESEWNR